MESGISINKHIYSLLSSNEKLKEMVGKNIYPLLAEENTTFPFIIFKRDNIYTSYSKDGNVTDEVEVSIAIADINYSNVIAIAEEVRTTVELYKNDYFRQLRFIGINEDFVDNSYVQELRFKAII